MFIYIFICCLFVYLGTRTTNDLKILQGVYPMKPSTDVWNKANACLTLFRSTLSKNTEKMLLFSSEYLLRLGVLCDLYCYVCFFLCTGRVVMVPFNLPCLYCLQHSFFANLFKVVFKHKWYWIRITHTLIICFRR